MLRRFELHFLLCWGLTLSFVSRPCEGSSLGLTVHVVPLEKDEGRTVRAHFSVIARAPCPDFSTVCTAGEDCETHLTSYPFTGARPAPGWCVRQWQKTIPSNYNASLSLGSITQFNVLINAPPTVRAYSNRLNQPPYVALPPPLRAAVNCPRTFSLSVKDLDGDRVRCRFAREDKGECHDCAQHSFLQLDEVTCTVSYTGQASQGQYFIYLVAEDYIPMPKTAQAVENTALSTVPVHLSLTVSESSTSCSNKVSAVTTPTSSVLPIMPYQEVTFNLGYKTDVESVTEIAVVGPPNLYRISDVSIDKMAISWTRSENSLTRLLPICFAANTVSLQSDMKCVWLYQREMAALPAGTELKCGKSEMTLLLPVATLGAVNLDELQLNSPTCLVTRNSTHLTAVIPLGGCGTKTVHAGSDLVYTNTLQSVRPHTMVSRLPTLILPLACRIPKARVAGPQYSIRMPTERETFGPVRFWMEFHFPGEGPMAKYTLNARFRPRVRREAGGASTYAEELSSRLDIGSRVKTLDLHVMSNCTLSRAEMMVTECMESETEDFATKHPITDQGCTPSNSTLEIETGTNNSRVFRMNMDAMVSNTSNAMYVECKVQLCISTMPSETCPDNCARATSPRAVLGSVFTSTYTLRSGPISLVVTTPAPTTTSAATAKPLNTVPSVATAAQNTTIASKAPAGTSLGTTLVLTTICLYLQKILLS